MTTTTISLTDLSEATKEYLRTEVTVEVVRVTDEVGVGEDGVISLRFTNADEDRGIRLHDVTVPLTVDDPDVLSLSARLATALEARATTCTDRCPPMICSREPTASRPTSRSGSAADGRCWVQSACTRS